MDLYGLGKLRKRKIRRNLYAGVAAVVVVLITVGVSRLEPAAPRVDRDTVYLDTVQRGPMVRQVRGTGTLVPEAIRWIPATTEGTVERNRDPPRRRGHPRHGDRRAAPAPPPWCPRTKKRIRDMPGYTEICRDIVGCAPGVSAQ